MRWYVSPDALEVRWYVVKSFPYKAPKHMAGRNECPMREQGYAPAREMRS